MDGERCRRPCRLPSRGRIERVFGVPAKRRLRSSMRFAVTISRSSYAARTAGGVHGSKCRAAHRTPGVCFATLGPGATNLLTGVSYAQLGRMPMVAITGQKPLRDNWQGRFQIVDIVETFGHHAQASVRVGDAERIAAETATVLRAARSGRRGAAVLELPQDVARTTVEARPSRISSPAPAPSSAALDHARAIIDEAKRPLVVLGSGANRPEASASIPAFVEQTSLHALSHPDGQGSVARGPSAMRRVARCQLA